MTKNYARGTIKELRQSRGCAAVFCRSAGRREWAHGRGTTNLNRCIRGCRRSYGKPPRWGLRSGGAAPRPRTPPGGGGGGGGQNPPPPNPPPPPPPAPTPARGEGR